MTSWATIGDRSGRPRLVVRVAGQVVQELELEGEVAIGSGQDNELSLADPRVAHRHAHLHLEGGSFVLSGVDEGSPVWVNGQLLVGRWQLRDGDQITIGDAELTFYEPPGDGAETASLPPGAALEVQPTGGQDAPPGTSVSDLNAQSAERPRRWPFVRAGAGGILLFLAIVATAAYFLIPGLSRESEPTPAAPPTAPPVLPTVQATTPEGTAENGVLFDSQLGQAQALVERSEFEEAITIYLELAGSEPDDARPEIGWAWALILDGQPDQALLHGNRSLELDPSSADALAVLSRAYLDSGDSGRALEMANRAVEADGASAVARAVLAEAYLADGDLASAQEQAELGLGLDASAAELHRVRGMLYQAVGEVERAITEFQAAATAQPQLWLRQQELGRLLLENARYDEAAVALKSALALRGKPETYTALGEAYFYLAESDRARSYLEQALSAGATDAGTYGLLSVILAQQDRCDDSEVYAQQALERNPADSRALEATELCGLPSPTKATPSPTVSPAIPAPTVSPVAPAPTQTDSVLTGRIAFPVWNELTGKYDTYVARPDGTDRALVATEMHQPSFDPGGQWLALNGERHHSLNLFIARADGTGQQEITEHAEDGLPHWSPDGNSLVFSSTQHGDKQSRVYVVDEIPFGGGRVPGRPLLAGGIEVLGEFPFWMPDGRIAYAGCDYAVTPARCGLLVVSAGPGADGPETVTDYGGDSAPAAFGERIAFMTDRDGNWEIYTVNADGSGLKRLTNRMANDGLPAWSPDGKTIAFVSDLGGVWAVWAMDPDGSNPRTLFDMGGGGLASDWLHERISWGP